MKLTEVVCPVGNRTVSPRVGIRSKCGTDLNIEFMTPASLSQMWRSHQLVIVVRRLGWAQHRKCVFLCKHGLIEDIIDRLSGSTHLQPTARYEHPSHHDEAGAAAHGRVQESTMLVPPRRSKSRSTRLQPTAGYKHPQCSSHHDEAGFTRGIHPKPKVYCFCRPGCGMIAFSRVTSF